MSSTQLNEREENVLAERDREKILSEHVLERHVRTLFLFMNIS
jgi:hypothetical protein